MCPERRGKHAQSSKPQNESPREGGDCVTGNETTRITSVFSFSVYEAPNRSWCVYRYRDSDTDKVFTAVGRELPNKKDLPVRLCGEWTVNKKTGKKQFEVEYTEVAPPSKKKEIIAFFESLKCGIGKIRATAIYLKFGDKTWDIIDKHPEMLKTVPGITDTSYQNLLAAIAANNVSRDMLGLFARAGVTISGNMLHKISQKMGENAVADLKKNPYLPYMSIKGFSFDKSEALATCLQIPLDSPLRLRAFIKKVLSDAAIAGHVCLPKDVLLQEMIRRCGCSRQSCIDAINAAFSEKAIRSANGFIFTPESYSSEESICKSIVRLVQSGGRPISGLDAIIDDYEASHFKLADSQRDAIKQVFENPVSVITGGPGVGKTTVTNAILWVHKEVFGESSNPLLLAPTGKAARRMAEATNYPASTIHSAVGWRGDDAEIPCDETMLSGNLVLIDEASMMDQSIASILLERIESGARVVFIGDIDQLPSVGAGYVLHDLIASKVIPTTRLTVIFRQSGTNPIVTNSHRINEGRTDLIETKTFRFIETYSDAEAFSEAIKLYIRCVRAYGDENVILLNPQRNNTDLSVDNFNLKLQQMLNPPKEGKFEVKVGKTVFRPGDKVMELKNTANAKNGDVGRILDVIRRPDPDSPRDWVYYAIIKFDNETAPLEYQVEDLRHVTLAWCTTVHKSQGSGATRS